MAKPPQGGGGNKKKMDFPVTLTLRDFIDPDLTDGRDDSDRIFSDGLGPYVDGTDGVSTRIRDTGGLLFNIGGPRWVGLDFSDRAEEPECGPDCNKDFVVTETTSESSGAAGGISAVDNFGDKLPGGLRGLIVGDTVRGMMKLGWGDEPRWSVRFKLAHLPRWSTSIDPNIRSKTSYLEITRVAEDMWFIEAIDPSILSGGGDRALLFSVRKRVYLDEGTYFMPFCLVVTLN